MVLLVGCRDHLCDNAEPYCEGNVLNTCDDQHDDMHWETTTCAGFCIEQGSAAFCASEMQPRAICDGVAAGTIVCDGAERVQCLRGGYVKVLQTCDAAELCQPDLYVGCTVLPGPIAECMARMPSPGPIVWPASFCMGQTAVRCEGPYAIGIQDCSQCMETTEYGGCVAPTPDPACTDATAVYPYGTCSGNTAIKCLGSYRLPDFTLGCFSGTCVAGGACSG